VAESNTLLTSLHNSIGKSEFLAKSNQISMKGVDHGAV
jgi:hypothetical protein